MSDHRSAEAALLSHIETIHMQLDILGSMVDARFGDGSDNINWGHVGDAARVSALLQEAIGDE